MKTVTKSVAIFATLLLVAITGCQKDLSKENLTTETNQINKKFDVSFAKEWYYKTFKKTSEWKKSKDAGKKLPNWENGVKLTIAGLEAIEFPLVSKHLNVSIPLSATNKSQLAKIANSSLSRIIFIKQKTGNILVREIYYIPDYDYLSQKNYDISNLQLNTIENNFSGRVIIKMWDGSVKKSLLFDKGLLKGIGKIKKNTENTSNVEECETIEICEYERFCEYVQSGDNWVPTGNCTAWEQTGICWVEEYCGQNPCEGMTPEECACNVYGVCEEGGGGNEEDPGEAINVEREFTIHHEQTGNNVNWNLIAYTSLSGMKFIQIQNNYFTSISRPNNPVIICQLGQCANIDPNSLAYCNIFSSSFTNNLLNSNQQAYSNQGVVLYYPNTGQNRALSSNHTWLASQDLN